MKPPAARWNAMRHCWDCSVLYWYCVIPGSSSWQRTFKRGTSRWIRQEQRLRVGTCDIALNAAADFTATACDGGHWWVYQLSGPPAHSKLLTQARGSGWMGLAGRASARSGVRRPQQASFGLAGDDNS